MAILSRRRQPYTDESHLELIRRLSRGDGPVRLGGPSIGREEDMVPIEQLPIDRMSGVASSPILSRESDPPDTIRPRPLVSPDTQPGFDPSQLLTRPSIIAPAELQQPGTIRPLTREPDAPTSATPTLSTIGPPPPRILSRSPAGASDSSGRAGTPLPSPAPDEMFQPFTRNVAPSVPALNTIGPPPVMFQTHNGRPVAAVGGGDSLARDQQLLDRQIAYKAPRSTKDALISAAFGFLHGGLPGAGANVLDYETNQGTRNQMAIGRDTGQTLGRIGREMQTRNQTNESLNDQTRRDLERSQINERMQKPPASSTRIVNAGEYEGVSPGTEIRQTWDPRQQRMVDTVTRGGKPVVSKAAPAKRAAPTQIEYDHGRAMLVVKNPEGATVSPILKQDGTPLTKEEHESGTVQTAFRLAPDGITQVQIERDRNTGQWVDSVGQNGQPITHGRVGKIDPNGRLNADKTQERGARQSAYQAEADEWGNKENTYRQNKTTEDREIKDKQAKIKDLYAEKRSWTPQLLGGRSTQEIQSDIDSLSAEIKTHRANSQKFQKDADDAAKQGTTARRSAGIYAGSPSAQSPRRARAGRIQPNEDPQVRDYANQFFGGDYRKAQAAIQAQRSKK